MDRIALLREAIESVAPQRTELFELEKKVNKLKHTITSTVEKVAGSFEPLGVDEDPEIEEELMDMISEVAYDVEMVWEGLDDWSSWGVGEPVSFWVPSTC